MNSRLTQIGFSQWVRLEWLERTANLVLAGNDEASIYNALQKLLEDKLSVGGNAKRGNREKVITILMKIWVRAPRATSTPFSGKALSFSHTCRMRTISRSTGAWPWRFIRSGGMLRPMWGDCSGSRERPRPARYSAVCGSNMGNATRYPERHDGCCGVSSIGGS